ncbi:hypothetical protein H9P43_006820 [Blastocladiella emersonii ATCC 22665]|nr:hypothetical protein H9P43_006820 [Blastocladiella emersonii ATCC 22665]
MLARTLLQAEIDSLSDEDAVDEPRITTGNIGPTALGSSNANVIAILRRAHILALLGVINPSGEESPAHLYGAFVYSRIEMLLENPELLAKFLARIRAIGPHDGGVLAEAMQRACTVANCRAWMRRYANPTRVRSTSSLALEAEDLTPIVLFLACVADNLEAALGCADVFVHGESTKIEIIAALIHTTSHSLMMHAREWYRASVYGDVDDDAIPSWLKANGPEDPLWCRFLVYAKFTPLLMYMRRDPARTHASPAANGEDLAGVYRVLQGALRPPAASGTVGDALVDQITIPATIFENFGRGIPMLGLRVPAMREEMVDGALQMIDATPFAALKIVTEIALVASASPAHLKYTQPGTAGKTTIVFLNADAETRSGAVQRVVDHPHDDTTSALFAAARAPLDDSAAERAINARVVKHRKSWPPTKVAQHWIKSAVATQTVKKAVAAIPAAEGPRNWTEFRENLELLAIPP